MPPNRLHAAMLQLFAAEFGQPLCDLIAAAGSYRAAVLVAAGDGGEWTDVMMAASKAGRVLREWSPVGIGLRDVIEDYAVEMIRLAEAAYALARWDYDPETEPGPILDRLRDAAFHASHWTPEGGPDAP